MHIVCCLPEGDLSDAVQPTKLKFSRQVIESSVLEKLSGGFIPFSLNLEQYCYKTFGDNL